MTIRRLALISLFALLVLAPTSASAGFFVAASTSSGSLRTASFLLGLAAALVTLALASSIAALPMVRSRLGHGVRSRQRIMQIVKEQQRQSASIGAIQRKLATIESKPLDTLENRVDIVGKRLDSINSRLIHIPDTVRVQKLNQVGADRAASAVSAQVTKEVTNAERRMRRHVQGVYDQLDGLAALYMTLQPRIGLPPMSRWAIGADLGAHLVRRVRETRPGSIVELGGGVSTLLIAMALPSDHEGRIVSIDHDPLFAEQTASWLVEHGVRDLVEIVVAPLVEQLVEGEVKPWYDLSRTDLPPAIDLLLVDGPPGSTGPLARSPAVPLLHDRFGPATVVVVDDTLREDEQRIVEHWCEQYQLEVVREYRHAKGTLELSPVAPTAYQ